MEYWYWKKEAPLNLKTIDPRSLPSVPLKSKNRLPEYAGIYFAIDSLSTIQYIGRSVNIRDRWRGHHRCNQLESMSGVKIAYLLIDAPELLDHIESALIEYFDPPLNNARIEYKPQDSRNAENRLKKTIRIDRQVWEAAERLAAVQGISTARWIEETIFNVLKAGNHISQDAQKPQDNRGGDRRSEEFKAQSNDA